MSISESDITRRLVKILTQVFGLRADQITPELTKEGVSSWDSLKQMDLVMSVEREFGISLEINDIVRMDSVANIVAVLQDKGADLGD
jgi:acyl carrier protein